MFPASLLPILGLALGGLASDALSSAPDEVQHAPTPTWVAPLDFDASSPRPASGSCEYLLLDFQENAAHSPFESYTHVAKRVLNGAGVESESEIAIEFDPSCQEVQVHSVTVHRDGVHLDQLAFEDFQVIQRESGLERLVHDGVRTALLILHDVRSGDVIEYSYTTRGRSMAFGDQYSSSRCTQWHVPVAHLRWRIVWPDGRELHTLGHGLEVAPSVAAIQGGREYVWDFRDRAPFAFDGQVPSWYDAMPWIQASEFADWNAVARKVAELFALPEDVGPEVREAAARISAQSSDPRERARLALRFVQSEVRYLAVNFGEGAYRPRAPREVLTRRFGDCKDKVVLLVALLRELGVGAEGALVNTSERHTLRDWLPAPSAFDHAIARIHLEGESLWVDPTLTYERGPLSEASIADYGCALCWSAGANGLVPFERKSEPAPWIHVVRTFRVDARRAAMLEIETSYEGAEATSFRAYVDTTTREQLAKDWLEYRADDYLALKVRQPLELTDDEAANRIVLREHYQVPNLWTERHDDGTWAPFVASEIQSEVAAPDVTHRTSPFALSFPKHVTCETVVHLPALWPIDPSRVSIRNPGFTFDSEVRCAQQRIDLRYDYRSLADNVPAAACSRYVADVERLRNNLGYEIVAPEALQRRSSNANVPREFGIAFAAFVGLVVLLGRAVRWLRNSELRKRAASNDSARESFVPTNGSETVWRDGDVLVVARNASLPPRCVLCNRPASTWIRRTFSWHDPAWYVLAIFAFLIYAIVASQVRRRATVEIGLCDEHAERRRKAATVAVGLALVGLGGCVGACFSEPLAGPLFLLGIVAFIAAAVVGLRKRSVLRPVRIDEHRLELRGAGTDFLREL